MRGVGYTHKTLDRIVQDMGELNERIGRIDRITDRIFDRLDKIADEVSIIADQAPIACSNCVNYHKVEDYGSIRGVCDVFGHSRIVSATGKCPNYRLKREPKEGEE